MKQRDSILWATIGLFSNIAKDVKSGENISDISSSLTYYWRDVRWHGICFSIFSQKKEREKKEFQLSKTVMLLNSAKTTIF